MNEARDQVVVSAPAVDIARLARAIAKEHTALQDDERHADAHEKKSASYRESAAKRRVELGRMLIEAKRGIRHGGWGPYLEKLGIEERSARDWMRLAGHVDEVKSEPNKSGSDLERIPTRREVNEARKAAPRDEQPDPPPTLECEPARAQMPKIDIHRELGSIHDKLCAAAAALPKNIRMEIAHELRDTARIIEEMK